MGGPRSGVRNLPSLIIGRTSLGPVPPPQNAGKAGLPLPLPTCASNILRGCRFPQGPPRLSLSRLIAPMAHRPTPFTGRVSTDHGIYRSCVGLFLNWARFHLWLRTGMALALDTGENHAGMAGEVRRDGAGIGWPPFKLSTPQW